jgi:hypothetical protein
MCNEKQANRTAVKALRETKSHYRTGCKGLNKKLSHRAFRNAGKQACREGG